MSSTAEPVHKSVSQRRKQTNTAGPSPSTPEPKPKSDSQRRKRARPDDQAIVALARRQHGVVTIAQLGRLGLAPRVAQRRVAAGRLHRVHHGVYALWPTIAVEGRWMAAVLACGPRAALSHHAAAAAHGFRRNRLDRIDVISPTGAGRIRDGIVVHFRADPIPEDVTTVAGIRCTTVARTLFDLAGIVDRRSLERLIDEAEVLRVLDARPARRRPAASSRRPCSDSARPRASRGRAMVAGYRVVRFTWRHVTREPRRVASTIETLLGANG